MRIHVSFIDRVGITQEVLALLGGRNLNLDAVEMVPPNVYIDAPTLSQQGGQYALVGGPRPKTKG